jgi:ubiquinone/menaquinone biosynthesis C-methylase UbiE
MTRRAMLRDGESLLEVAVGTGLTFTPLSLANPHGQNVGVDASRAMLSRCRWRLEAHGTSSYQLHLGDARQLPFCDGTFDVIVCCHLFDLLPELDVSRAARELHRVCREGGRLLVTNVTASSGGHLPRSLLARLAGLRAVEVGSALQEAGFQDTSRLVYSQFGFKAELVRSIKLDQHRLRKDAMASAC